MGSNEMSSVDSSSSGFLQNRLNRTVGTRVGCEPRRGTGGQTQNQRRAGPEAELEGRRLRTNWSITGFHGGHRINYLLDYTSYDNVLGIVFHNKMVVKTLAPFL